MASPLSLLYSGWMKLGWTGKYTVGSDGRLVAFGDDGGVFTLRDAGGIVTLGDAGGIGSRRDGGVTVRTAVCGGVMLGSAGFAMALSNILARSTMACCWESPNWANGATGAGLVRDSVRARAATMAPSMEDFFGTGHWCGKNFTVLEVRYALVFRT